MPKPEDKGSVTRTKENSTTGDGGWSTSVRYEDPQGNSMSIRRGSYDRGSSAGAYNETDVSCANGAKVPENNHQKLNESLKSGFWFPDALSSLFPVRDHDFGDTNPIAEACKVAPKPRKR